jgi:hypothetical protein
MADIGLEAIECQDDTAVGFGEALEALGILEREGEEFVVTISEIRDGALGNGNGTVD